MFEPRDEPTCPKCGGSMVRRVRGSDGAVFWGCSDFPRCRGTRELVTDAHGGPRPAAGFGVPVRRGPRRGRRFDRLVLACGAVGLSIGVGFIVVGLNSGPVTYCFLGAILVALVALVVLLSPFLPRDFARGSALKIAFFCVFAAVFIVALVPVSNWFAQYLTGVIMQSVPTHSPAAPSIAH
jgi:hypothetical protein